MKSLSPAMPRCIAMAALALVGAWPLAAQAQLIGVSKDTHAACQMLAQLRGLTGAARDAIEGDARGFVLVRDRAEGLMKLMPEAPPSRYEPLRPLVSKIEKNARSLVAQQEVVRRARKALAAVPRQASDLLSHVETLHSLKLKAGASAAELAAVGQMLMLTQRMGWSAAVLMPPTGMSAEAVFLLGKDLNSFREITDGLTQGSREFRLLAAKPPLQRQTLAAISQLLDELRGGVNEAVLGQLQTLVNAQEAQQHLLADADGLDRPLESSCLGASRAEREDR